MRDLPQYVDLTHVNILAELYMKCGDFAKAQEVIDDAYTAAAEQDPTFTLPIDLQVNYDCNHENCASRSQVLRACI